MWSYILYYLTHSCVQYVNLDLLQFRLYYYAGDLAVELSSLLDDGGDDDGDDDDDDDNAGCWMMMMMMMLMMLMMQVS